MLIPRHKDVLSSGWLSLDDEVKILQMAATFWLGQRCNRLRAMATRRTSVWMEGVFS